MILKAYAFHMKTHNDPPNNFVQATGEINHVSLFLKLPKLLIFIFDKILCKKELADYSLSIHLKKIVCLVKLKKY